MRPLVDGACRTRRGLLTVGFGMIFLTAPMTVTARGAPELPAAPEHDVVIRLPLDTGGYETSRSWYNPITGDYLILLYSPGEGRYYILTDGKQIGPLADSSLAIVYANSMRRWGFTYNDQSGSWVVMDNRVLGPYPRAYWLTFSGDGKHYAFITQRLDRSQATVVTDRGQYGPYNSVYGLSFAGNAVQYYRLADSPGVGGRTREYFRDGKTADAFQFGSPPNAVTLEQGSESDTIEYLGQRLVGRISDIRFAGGYRPPRLYTVEVEDRGGMFILWPRGVHDATGPGGQHEIDLFRQSQDGSHFLYVAVDNTWKTRTLVVDGVPVGAAGKDLVDIVVDNSGSRFGYVRELYGPPETFPPPESDFAEITSLLESEEKLQKLLEYYTYNAEDETFMRRPDTEAVPDGVITGLLKELSLSRFRGELRKYVEADGRVYGPFGQVQGLALSSDGTRLGFVEHRLDKDGTTVSSVIHVDDGASDPLPGSVSGSGFVGPSAYYYVTVPDPGSGRWSGTAVFDGTAITSASTVHVVRDGVWSMGLASVAGDTLRFREF